LFHCEIQPPLISSSPEVFTLPTAYLIALTLLLQSALAAQTPKKPACTKANVGQVWPDRPFRGPCVPLEVCSYGTFRYHWRAETVSLAQLPRKSRNPCESRARSKHSPSAPEAVPAEAVPPLK
jgi:hypothetical protein